jgi:hypothetical protein
VPRRDYDWTPSVRDRSDRRDPLGQDVPARHAPIRSAGVDRRPAPAAHGPGPPTAARRRRARPGHPGRRPRRREPASAAPGTGSHRSATSPRW